jgi:hypothetical protein
MKMAGLKKLCHFYLLTKIEKSGIIFAKIPAEVKRGKRKNYEKNT